MTGTTCPACGHERSDFTRPRTTRAVLRLLRITPRALCGARDADDSGWGEPPCGCRAPFHGS